jgi:hypothetical protein
MTYIPSDAKLVNLNPDGDSKPRSPVPDADQHTAPPGRFGNYFGNFIFHKEIQIGFSMVPHCRMHTIVRVTRLGEFRLLGDFYL